MTTETFVFQIDPNIGSDNQRLRDHKTNAKVQNNKEKALCGVQGTGTDVPSQVFVVKEGEIEAVMFAVHVTKTSINIPNAQTSKYPYSILTMQSF
jgi:hypothetical protein